MSSGPSTISKTFLFWGFELLGGGGCAILGSLFGYGEAGFVVGLLVGGIAYLVMHSWLPPESE